MSYLNRRHPRPRDADAAWKLYGADFLITSNLAIVEELETARAQQGRVFRIEAKQRAAATFRKFRYTKLV